MTKVSKPNSSSFKEFFELLWINFKVQMIALAEFFRVVFKYYTANFRFCKIDMSLLITYLFNSPYEISKKFLIEKGEKEIYLYGETPLTTLDDIARQCQITKNDTVFELGCGRGRTCFWLNSFIGCKVIGIETIPEFATRAQEIKSRFDVKNVEFRQQNMLQTDFSKATVIYLYGTCLEESFIQKLVARFQSLPAGTKVITVSYSLEDFTSLPYFEVMKRFTAKFPWGTTDVYLQVKK